RDTWPALVVRERHDTIRGAHRRQRGLRPPLLVGETKGPVVNILPASIPVFGPREDKGARAPTSERAFDLAPEEVGLFLAAIPETVEADFAQDHRTVPGDRMQPRDVGLERVPFFEIDVERDQIQEFQPQVLGGREIDVGDEAARILVLDDLVESAEVPFDSRGTEPPHELWRDLVAQGVAQQRRVPGDGPDLLPNELLEVGSTLAIDQIADIPLSGEPDHHTESIAFGDIEQWPGRHRENTNGVDSGCGHLSEVLPDHLEIGVFVSMLVGPKR